MTVSTASSQNHTTTPTYAQIGAGTCGVIFQQTGTDEIAKRARTSQWAHQLWNDYRMHRRIRKAFAKHSHLNVDIRIPQHKHYISAIHDIGEQWWSEHESKFPAKFESLPKDVLIAERIWPLPEYIRHNLIEKYCPKDKEGAHSNAANADCLARIYLGAERPVRSGSRYFSLRNFPLFADDLEHLGLSATGYASTMAQALAVMHWEARCDARDVEFVLGSPREDEDDFDLIEDPLDAIPARSTTLDLPRRDIRFWLLDFNQVQHITMDEGGIESAAKAYMDNDKYFPRPHKPTARDQKLWETFEAAYLRTSEDVWDLHELKGKVVEPGWRELPHAFLEWVMEMEGKRLQDKAAAEERIANDAYED